MSKTPSRLRRFAIVSLLGVVVVVVVLVGFYRHLAIAQIHNMGAQNSVALAGTLSNFLRPLFNQLLRHPPGISPEQLRTRKGIALLDHAVRQQLRGHGVAKIKIFAANGLTVYSTEMTQVGEVQRGNPGVRAALNGENTSNVVHKDTFNAWDRVVENRDLIQTYIPIHTGMGTRIIGAFEIYSDVTPMFEHVAETQRQIILGVLLILGTFYAALFFLFRKVVLALQREESQRAEYLAQVENAKADLEQRVAERTRDLETSRAFVQSTIDAIPDPILVIAPNHRIESMNSAARARLPDGETNSEGVCCYSVVTGSAAPCAGHDSPCPLREVLDSEQNITVTHRHPRPDGGHRVVQVMASPLRDADGTVTGIVEVNHDITEFAETLETLQESEQRFRDVANAAGEYIWEIDVGGCYSYISDRVQTVLGYSPTELVGQRPGDYMPDADGQQLHKRLDFDDPRPFHNLEFRGTTRSGDTIWQNISGVPVRDDQRVVGFRGVVQDITGRKKAEAAALEGEARLQAVMDSVLDGIVVINQEGIVELCNPAAETLFGYASEEVIGQNVEMLMPEPYKSPHAGYLKRYLRTNEPHIVGIGGREVQGLRKDGSVFPMDLWVAEMKHGDEPRFVGVLRDLTELKLAEKELEDARQQYFHQEKMAAIGQLAAGIIHEVGNPISAIAGSIEEVESLNVTGGRRDSEASEHLHRIREHTERLANITREISDFATPRPMERDLVSLNELVRSTSHLLRYDKRWKKIDVELDLDMELPAVMAVADQITQVIMNLLINAADACEGLTDTRPAIKISTRVESEWAIMTVSDNGHGMDADTMLHAADAFFTTKPPGKGTGLGLALCHSIIDGLDGKISMKSTVGQGTKIDVYMPLTSNLDEASTA